MIVTCRDCGRKGNERPDDFAPSLCPGCYDKRLARVHEQFVRVLPTMDTPQKAVQWMATALHEIGGETPQAAKDHAEYLLLQVMMDRG